MRWIARLVVVIIAMIIVGLGAGLALPGSHVAVTRATYGSPPAGLWAVLTDFDRWPEWNPGIERVERLPDRNGHPMLMTTGEWGEMPTEIVAMDAPHRLVTELDGGGFSGRWTYVLDAVDGGTRLTITEEGEVSNPLFRTMMIFHDNYATMIEFHRALGTRLGERVEAARVEAGGG